MSTDDLKPIDQKALAEFVYEALCGLGVIDDADEVLGAYYDDGDFEAVKRGQKHYNNAISFYNRLLGDDKEQPDPIQLISDQDLDDWDFVEVKRCGKCGQTV